jgi:patatin-like phospholipase/acyl hydrolase
VIVAEPSTCHSPFATAYYEVPVSLNAVTHVFQHQPLNKAVVRSLNADLRVKDLIDHIRSIGYPQQ